MAANLAGMFAQLNNAIQNSPVEEAQGLLDMTSQGFGGVAGALSGADPYSFMNQGAKQLQGKEQMGQMDLSTPEGMQQAAQVYQKMGKMSEALEMQQQAQVLQQRLEEKEKAENAKNSAILDAGNLTIQENAIKTKSRAQLNQAVMLAAREGDNTAKSALKAGNLSPEAYISKVMGDKSLYELSKGEGLFDKDGNRIALNPDLSTTGGKGDLSVHDKKQWDTLTTSAYESEAWAKKAEALAQQVEASSGWNAGFGATVEDSLLGMMGKRDDPQYLRTQVNSIRNHEAIGMLPKGPASDKDITLVMKGVPPENAGKEEVVAFLNATARVSRRLAEYDKMRAEYTIKQDRAAFQKDWDTKMGREARTEKIQATPSWAVEALQSSPELRDDFLSQYGWLPEGEQ